MAIPLEVVRLDPTGTPAANRTALLAGRAKFVSRLDPAGLEQALSSGQEVFFYAMRSNAALLISPTVIKVGLVVGTVLAAAAVAAGISELINEIKAKHQAEHGDNPNFYQCTLVVDQFLRNHLERPNTVPGYDSESVMDLESAEHLDDILVEADEIMAACLEMLGGSGGGN